MAQRVKTDESRATFPRSRTFGTAAVSARNRFSWIVSTESLLRLGLSFVLATALWLYVSGKSNPIQAWDFPTPLTVTPQGVRDGLTITNNLDVIRVRVQADPSTTQVTQASLPAFLNLAGLGPGLHSVQVSVLPDPGIQVLQVTPSHLQVDLAAVQGRHVPIQPQIYGKPPRGYAVNSISVTPNTINVSGPSTTVSQIARGVVYLSLSGVSTSVTDTYKPFLEDARNNTVSSRLLTTDPAQVHVTVKIAQLSSYKTLAVVASIRGQPKAGFGVTSVTSSPSSLTAYGSPDVLSGVTKALTDPVWVNGRGGGVVTRRVRARLPKGINANTSWVTVRAQISAVVGSSSVEVAVVPENEQSGLVVRIPQPRLLVTLVGPSNQIQSAARQMRAYVDLTGLGPGTYFLQPRVSAPKGLQIEGVYPTRMTVILLAGSSG